MKNVNLLGAVLLILASFHTQAQTTGKATSAQPVSSANNPTNASTIGSSTTPDPGAVGNDRIGRGASAGRKNRSATTSSATVDGSNGSATNDGATGQSGSPAPLPALSTSTGTTTPSSNRKPKSLPRQGSKKP
ncbi:hypothetical protein BH09BAC4_BH09BAC4_43820 [soil metagenome]